METSISTVVNISIILGIAVTVVQIAIIFWILHVSRRNFEFQKKETLFLKIQKHNELLVERINAQENSFSLVAKEIHDNVNQLVSLMRMNLATLKIIEEPDNIQQFDYLKELNMLIIGSLTGISKSLNPTLILEYGLQAMIKEEFKRIESNTDAKLTLNTNFIIDDLPKEVQLNIFRIFQEATRNAIQHGQSTKVILSFDRSHYNTTIKITDNGKGFNLNSLDSDRISQGLSNMKGRASNIGGKLTITSSKGNGTTISVIIPG